MSELQPYPIADLTSCYSPYGDFAYNLALAINNESDDSSPVTITAKKYLDCENKFIQTYKDLKGCEITEIERSDKLNPLQDEIHDAKSDFIKAVARIITKTGDK